MTQRRPSDRRGGAGLGRVSLVGATQVARRPSCGSQTGWTTARPVTPLTALVPATGDSPARGGLPATSSNQASPVPDTRPLRVPVGGAAISSSRMTTVAVDRSYPQAGSPMFSSVLRRLAAIPDVLVDFLIALALIGCSCLDAVFPSGRLTGEHAIMIAISMLPLTLRRRWPAAITFLTGVGLLNNLDFGYKDSFFQTFGLLLAAYTMYSRSPWGWRMSGHHRPPLHRAQWILRGRLAQPGSGQPDRHPLQLSPLPAAPGARLQRPYPSRLRRQGRGGAAPARS